MPGALKRGCCNATAFIFNFKSSLKKNFRPYVQVDGGRDDDGGDVDAFLQLRFGNLFRQMQIP